MQERPKWSRSEIDKLRKYCYRDTKIVLDALPAMSSILEEEQIKLKRFYTINQIGIQTFLSSVKGLVDNFFYNMDFNQVHFTKWPDRVHDAYRGARVECFRTGKIKKANYIDANSLYAHAAMLIDFPDLLDQRLIKNPMGMYDKGELFNELGMSRCLIENKKDEIGLLQIVTGKLY